MRKHKEVNVRGTLVKCGKCVKIPPDTELRVVGGDVQFVKIGNSPKIGSGVIIHTGAVLGDNVTICDNVYIGTNVIIGDNCVIERDRIVMAPEDDDPDLMDVPTRKESRRSLGVGI